MRLLLALVLCAGCTISSTQRNATTDTTGQSSNVDGPTDAGVGNVSVTDMATRPPTAPTPPSDMASPIVIDAAIAPVGDFAQSPPADMAQSWFQCPIESVVVTRSSQFQFALDDQYVYSLNGTAGSSASYTVGIFRTPKSGGSSMLVVDGVDTIGAGDGPGPVLAVGATNVYWATMGVHNDSEFSSVIGTAPKSGGQAQILATVPAGGDPCSYEPRYGHVKALNVDQQNLYIGDALDNFYCQNAGAEGIVLSMSRGSTTLTQLAFVPNFNLAMDDAYLYWGGASWVSDNIGVSRIAKAGGTAEAVSTVDSAGPLAVDTTNVYFADHNSSVYAVPRSGGVAVKLYDAPVKNGTVIVNGLTARNGRVYWSAVGVDWRGTSGATGIWTIRIDGTDLQRLTNWQVGSLQSDDAYLYWSRGPIERSCL